MLFCQDKKKKRFAVILKYLLGVPGVCTIHLETYWNGW